MMLSKKGVEPSTAGTENSEWIEFDLAPFPLFSSRSKWLIRPHDRALPVAELPTRKRRGARANESALTAPPNQTEPEGVGPGTFPLAQTPTDPPRPGGADNALSSNFQSLVTNSTSANVDCHHHLKQVDLGKKVDQLVQLISRHVSPWRDQLASRAARLTTERLTSSPYCSRIGPSFRCRQTRL